MKLNNIKKFEKFKEILAEHSGEGEALTKKEILDKLENEYAITLAKNTFKSYIDKLNELGITVHITEEKGQKEKRYSIEPQLLNKNELKILVDCIAANKSIPYDVTEDIVTKLIKSNNYYARYTLKRNLKIEESCKTVNEEVMSSIKAAYYAIDEEKKIKFNYCVYDKDYKLKEKENAYEVYPIAFAVNHEYYYLYAMYESGSVYNFRIDKIKNVEVVDKKKETEMDETLQDIKDKFDVIKYNKKCFKMYGGKKEITVKIKVRDKNMAAYVLDELGKYARKYTESDELYIEFDAFESNGLVKWLISLGTAAEVVSPVKLRTELKAKVQEIANLYQ